MQYHSRELMPDFSAREQLLARAADKINSFIEDVAELPVDTHPRAAEIREHLERYDFDSPLDAREVLDDCADMLTRWGMHNTHPRYFGLFNPSVAFMSVIADQLVAAFNPQLGVWHHNPAGCEIEAHLIRHFAALFALPRETSSGYFTSGGSEANLMGVQLALASIFPRYSQEGAAALDRRPVFYVSEECHHSFLKIAAQSGLGRDALRTVCAGEDLRMDVAALADAVEKDRRNGRAPFLVAGTAGTTSAGAVDPLDEIADFCRAERLHFHVDAAWAGSAILSPVLAKHLAGMEKADSITIDPHKWMSVPMGAGLFLCRDRTALGHAFGAETAYVPASDEEFEEPYVHSPQWSRRFIGLKLFMALAVAGRSGYAAVLEGQTALGDKLKTLLSEDGWVLENDTPFPIACFTASGLGDDSHEAIAREIVSRGRAWISTTMLRRRKVLRACITSFRSTETDLAILIDELARARELIS